MWTRNSELGISTRRYSRDGSKLLKESWTLRADPVGQTDSMFRTETRALATDPIARATFRRYWAFISPGRVDDSMALVATVEA